MKRSTERILTTHVGSLVRPPEVIEAMRAIEAGQTYDERAFAETLRRSVAEVVRRQAEAGVDVPSDGEFGKRSWTQYVRDRLGGLEWRERQPGEEAPIGSRSPFTALFPGFFASQSEGGQGGGGQRGPAGSWVCAAPLTYTGQKQLQRDIDNFKAALTQVQVEEAFLPVAAPCSVEVGLPNRYYKTEEEYAFAVADAMKDEYKAIVDAGLLVQLDDAYLATVAVRLFEGRDPQGYRKYAELRVEATNHALKGIPSDRVRYHICWGSQPTPHTWDAPLEEFVDLVLKVNADAHCIEAANPRHEHEWQLWEKVKLPEGKVLVPGLVSHATNIVEHPELIAWRIGNFARLVGRENVMAGTDCGFAQGWQTQRVHPEIQWAKLSAIAEGSKLASQRLW